MRAHELLLRVGGGSVGVMVLKRPGVVRSLVSEACAKFRQRLMPANQSIPVVVTDFMAEMSEQRSVGFVQLCSAALPLGVVSLGCDS